ncbi:hypothetical protein PC112_g22000 [Phytophthora cactorum]|nr:hypothetical protein PC112_g22000 [Phytophthora cactorum]
MKATAESLVEAKAVRRLGYPRRNIRDWVAKKAQIMDLQGAQTSKTLKGHGKTEIIPFSDALVMFMEDLRRDEETEPATKKKEADVVETHVTFALEFWGKYGVKHTAAEIYNVDETVIYYDTPLKEIWAIRDHKGYAKIRKTETQRARMTSVLAARADAKTTSNFVYCAR